MNKECCKYCSCLNFYDMYFCENSNNLFYIEDIENFKCENFTKREGKFWINGEW